MKRCLAAMLETPTTLGLCDISPSCPAVVAAQLDMLPVSVCAIVSAYVMATPASAQADVDDTLVLLQRADRAVQNPGDVEDDNLQTLIEQTQDLKKMYKRLRSVADLIGDHVVSSLISGHSDVVANDGLMEQDITVFSRQLTQVVRCGCYDADMLAGPAKLPRELRLPRGGPRGDRPVGVCAGSLCLARERPAALLKQHFGRDAKGTGDFLHGEPP